jgi:hypothetical protein
MVAASAGTALAMRRVRRQRTCCKPKKEVLLVRIEIR